MTETEALELHARFTRRRSTVRKIDGMWWVFTRWYGRPLVLGYSTYLLAVIQADYFARIR